MRRNNPQGFALINGPAISGGGPGMNSQNLSSEIAEEEAI